MNILLVSTEFPPGPGGIGTHAYQLALGFSRRGWQVSVLTPQDCASEAEIRAFNHKQPFRVFRQRHWPTSVLEGTIRLASLLKMSTSYRPDIILATGSQSVWLAATLNRFLPTTWVAVAHGGIEFGTRVAWKRTLSRWAYSQPAAVICVSEYARQLMLDLGVSPTHVDVIPNGADESLYYPLIDGSTQALCQRLGLEQAKILLTVGCVSERKGQEVVVSALPYILQDCPNVHYVMAGVPLLGPRLGQLAQELGVIDHVHFLGRVDQPTLLAAYNACDLFIMTSRHSSDGDSEGYGIAVIEAALCGKPAVVSGESGLAEAVVDGQTGLLVPEDAPQETAEAILALLKDENRRTAMGMQARTRALGEGTWTQRVSTYAHLIEAIDDARNMPTATRSIKNLDL